MQLKYFMTNIYERLSVSYRKADVRPIFQPHSTVHATPFHLIASSFDAPIVMKMNKHVKRIRAICMQRIPSIKFDVCCYYTRLSGMKREKEVERERERERQRERE